MLGPIQDALNDSAASAAMLERLELAYRNSLRLLKLVNSLLDFARIEAGRAQVRFEPIDLSELTAGVASVFPSTDFLPVSGGN